MSMFAIGQEASLTFIGTVIAGETWLALILLVKKAVQDVFRDHASIICRSPERPDLPLSQEEANGWLMASIRGREPLAAEGRGIGKRIDYYVAAEKSADKGAKKAFNDRRRSARNANKAPELADELGQRLAQIDADEAADRSTRLAKRIDLQLPSANSVIVQERSRVADDPDPDRTALTQQLADARAAEDVARRDRTCHAESEAAVYASPREEPTEGLRTRTVV